MLREETQHGLFQQGCVKRLARVQDEEPSAVAQIRLALLEEAALPRREREAARH